MSTSRGIEGGTRDVPPNATSYEVVWFVFSFVGVIGAMILLTIGINDYRWLLQQQENGMKRLLLRGRLVGEGTRGFVQVLSLALSILQLDTPANLAGGPRAVHFAFVQVWVQGQGINIAAGSWTIASIVLCFASLVSLYNRQKMIQHQ